jgi:hypothetical protein
VRIILAAADFSREITSAVLWLNERNLDIRCVRLTPYALGERTLVDVQQVIPLPEMGDYLVQVRAKAEKVREEQARDFTRFEVRIGEQTYLRLSKRIALLRVCRYLSDKGVSPESIAALSPKRKAERVVFGLDGDLNASAFQTAARERTSSVPGASNFDTKHWFCADGELVKANGKTYAFSNQWGGEQWRETMNQIRSAYPDYKIAFTEAV